MKKFVNDRRNRSSNTKSVLSFKTLMTGKHAVTALSGASPCSKRSTQVLLNEGPSFKENSLEFTTLDPTETPSSTSFSSEADSFVPGCIQVATNDEEIEFSDPYLVPNSRKTRPRATQLDGQAHDAANHTKSMNRIAAVIKETSPFNQVITFSNTGKDQEADQDTHSLTSHSSRGDLGEAKPILKPSTKLTSLGTFDFPISTDSQTKLNPTVSARKSLSLGTGCFEIPSSEAEASPSDVAEEEPQGFSFSSPLSAIGKGLKTLGTLALPRVLQFELTTRQQLEPPATPVSQSEPAENPHETARMAQHRLKTERECLYWNKVVTRLIQTYGKNHTKTAEGLLQLGHAYLLNSEYPQAVVTFQSACRILNDMERTRDNRLAFARVIDAIGMAWARVSRDDDRDHCRKAMTALEEAFQIRYELLGAWSVDTVETLNKIASVHLQFGEYDEACNAYWEVFCVRRSIFGNSHPSVAVAAHSLGNVYVKLAATRDAANFFQIALDIFNEMNLPNKHPALTRLMRDYKRLDRLQALRGTCIDERPYRA